MDAAAAVARCGRRTQGLATTRQLRAAGLSPGPLARAIEAGTVLRVHRRVYALEPLPPRPRFLVTDDGPAPAYVARVRAALLSVGPGAVARGRTAAALHGWPMLVEPTRTVDVAVPHGSRRAAVEDVHVAERRDVRVARVVAVSGAAPLPVMPPVQTVLDCCLSLPLLQAVVVCDSALRARTVTLAELRRASRQLAGVRDAERVRQVLDLADPESGSVLETVLRVRMTLHEICGFGTQQVLHDGAGRAVLRADFVFEDARLVVEVDGQKWHQDVARDRRRDNALAALGWRVLRYTWSQVVHHPDAVLAEIAAALGLRTSDCHLAAARLLRAA